MIRFDTRAGAGRIGRFVLVLAAGLSTAAMGAAAQAETMAGDANAILKAMSDYVSSQQTIEFAFDI